MTTACRWTSSTTPRVVPGRHEDRCADYADVDECPGCQPCTSPHCRVCGRAHADGTCAECLAETRETLREIGRMCDALPEEVEHRGIEGEAMMLLGPAADPERRGHMEASVLAGRIPWDAIEKSHTRDCKKPEGECIGCAGELHPEIVLGGWEAVWREALDHDEPAERFDLAPTVDYLDRTLAYMGGYPHVPFEDFARDLRRCSTHLLAVLHDQNQGDRANVGCFECGGDLERRLGKQGFEDFWTCAKCRRRYTSPEYNFALRAAIEASAAETEEESA